MAAARAGEIKIWELAAFQPEAERRQSSMRGVYASQPHGTQDTHCSTGYGPRHRTLSVVKGTHCGTKRSPKYKTLSMVRVTHESTAQSILRRFKGTHGGTRRSWRCMTFTAVQDTHRSTAQSIVEEVEWDERCQPKQQHQLPPLALDRQLEGLPPLVPVRTVHHKVSE